MALGAAAHFRLNWRIYRRTRTRRCIQSRHSRSSLCMSIYYYHHASASSHKPQHWMPRSCADALAILISSKVSTLRDSRSLPRFKKRHFRCYCTIRELMITPCACQLIRRPRNLIGQSQSGTGKTAAFTLNMLSRVETGMLAPQVSISASLTAFMDFRGKRQPCRTL